jgi:uncharacterized protein YndB with AHSA1/START domain
MTELLLTQTIEAPPAVVFEFLIKPELLLRWLGISVEIDPQPGGIFRVDITGGDIARGTYVDIVPDQRVSFTWGWEDNDGVPPGSSTVTIELTATADGTDLILTHAGLPDDAIADHGSGWVYFTERLATVASGLTNPPVDVSQIAETPEETS